MEKKKKTQTSLNKEKKEREGMGSLKARKKTNKVTEKKNR